MAGPKGPAAGLRGLQVFHRLRHLGDEVTAELDERRVRGWRDDDDPAPLRAADVPLHLVVAEHELARRRDLVDRRRRRGHRTRLARRSGAGRRGRLRSDEARTREVTRARRRWRQAPPPSTTAGGGTSPGASTASKVRPSAAVCAPAGRTAPRSPVRRARRLARARWTRVRAVTSCVSEPRGDVVEGELPVKAGQRRPPLWPGQRHHRATHQPAALPCEQRRLRISRRRRRLDLRSPAPRAAARPASGRSARSARPAPTTPPAARRPRSAPAPPPTGPGPDRLPLPDPSRRDRPHFGPELPVHAHHLQVIDERPAISFPARHCRRSGRP